MRRTPARTLETWRSLRSKGRDVWAKIQASAESVGSIVAMVRGPPPARARRRKREPRDSRVVGEDIRGKVELFGDENQYLPWRDFAGFRQAAGKP